jgi:cytochrome c oxidase cbb3-type subunit 3
MSEKHDISGEQTTGHVWDGIADLTNQPPRWWMLGLAASALFCIVYFLYYPTFPVTTMGTFTKGIGGWTSINEMQEAQDEVEAVRGKYEARLKGLAPAAILADNELAESVPEKCCSATTAPVATAPTVSAHTTRRACLHRS